MSRPVKYNNGVIYRICCNDLEIADEYVGSTTNFIGRRCCHKTSCHNGNSPSYNYTLYQFIREHGGWDNWVMVQIEKYEAKDKGDLLSRERFYVESRKPTLNYYIPGRTRAQWRTDNKEVIAEKGKIYYEENKEKFAEISKKYYVENKEKIAKRGKELREENKEKYKKRYHENKEKFKEKYTCECGTTMTLGGKTRHEKTKKHTDFISGKIKTSTEPTYTCECGSTLQLCSKVRHEKSKKHIEFISEK
jgi:hypothetical protein